MRVNLVVYETDIPNGLSVLNRIKAPRTSILHWTEDNNAEVVSLLKTKPLLTPKWVVIIKCKEVSENIYNILKFDSNNLVLCSKKDQFENICEDLGTKGIPFKKLNNCEIKEEVLQRYIMESLPLTEDLALYIMNRSRNYFPKILECISVLSHLEKITKKDIDNYISFKVHTSPLGIIQALLGSNRNIKGVLDQIYVNRYNMKRFLKTLNETIDQCCRIYDEIQEGRLTRVNYREFRLENEYLSEYTKKTVLDMFDVISYERLIYLKYTLSNVGTDSFSIYRLLYMTGGK